MLEELLVWYCAPTLAGLKTGSLFSCPFRDEGALHGRLTSLNRSLRGKGLAVIPLRYRDGRALLYVYRRTRLTRDLSRDEARGLLSQRGYAPDRPSSCIARLIRKLEHGGDFPHEIGLFLGYPPEDVTGFLAGKTPKLSGLWKVYGNAEAAKARFAEYRRCTEAYRAQLSFGTPLERLAVAEA